MFRIDLGPDPIEQEAILRRKRLDEERKKRIFDPKVRCLGIDVNALGTQINQKQQLQSIDKERDEAFNQFVVETSRVLAQLDNETQFRRRLNNVELNKFREANQRFDQRREFFLNDPNQLKKDLPPRIGDQDERCGVSGLQVFSGEDLGAEERKRRQLLQRRVWEAERRQEAQKREQAAQEARQREEDYLRMVLSKQKELSELQRQQMQARLDEIKELNRQLAQSKKEREEKEKEQRQKPELATLLVPALFIRGKEPGSDSWRALTEEEKQKAIEEQERTLAEIEQRRQQEQDINQMWAEETIAVAQAASLLDREKARLQRERNARLAAENKMKSVEDKARVHQMNRVFTSNAPTEAFFQQFNTTSR